MVERLSGAQSVVGSGITKTIIIIIYIMWCLGICEALKLYTFAHVEQSYNNNYYVSLSENSKRETNLAVS